jgi:hypothetical protein
MVPESSGILWIHAKAGFDVLEGEFFKLSVGSTESAHGQAGR